MKRVGRKILSVSVAFFVLVTCLLSSGCSIDEPFSVCDQAGRKVFVKDSPTRIVSGYYISTSVCVALGLTDKLVGIETNSDKRPLYSLLNSDAIKVAIDVGSAKNFDLESCCQADPDLVILPYKAKDSAAVLEELGISAIVVNPETQDGFIEMIELIAKVTGTEDKANQLTEYYNEKTAFIKDVVKGIADGERPEVFMGSASGYLTTAPKDMYQSYIINLAGGKNCGDVYTGNNKVEVGKEQFVNMNADVIIIPTNANANGYAYDKSVYADDSVLSTVNAIKNGEVYFMPKGFESWDSPTPSSILGALYILHVLHPDLYSEEDFKDEVCSFYERFYNIRIDKDSITV